MADQQPARRGLLARGESLRKQQSPASAELREGKSAEAPESAIVRFVMRHHLARRFATFHERDDQRLEREMMASDRERARIVSRVFAIAAVISFLALALFAHPISVAFRGTISPWFGGGVFALYALYELLYRIGVGRFLAVGLKFPRGARFANALIEISFPSLVVLILARTVPMPVALSLPPTFIYFIFIALSTLRLDPPLTIVTGILAGAEYLAIVLLSGTPYSPSATPLLDALPNHISKALILLVTGVVGGLVAREIRRRIRNTIQAQDEQARVVQVFGSHVSPQVRDRLLSQPDQLPAEDRDLCVMFLDVRGFTHYSEGHTPEEVMALLSTLFDFSVKAVGDHGGIVNKFLGDGFMAVFGAPADDPSARIHALAAAIEISTALKEKIRSGELPEIRIGIGLHAGRALTGEIGTYARKEYTIIGDVVNLASRIEALNKEYGSEILASADVVAKADGVGAAAQPLGQVQIRGHEAEVQLFRIR